MIEPENNPIEDAGETILLYLDGTLPSERVANLNERLKADTAVRQKFAELLLQEIHLAEIGKDTGTIGVVETVGSIHAGGEPTFGTPGTRPFPKRPVIRAPWTLPAVWAAAASIVLLIGLGIRFFGTTSGTPTLLATASGRVVLERGTEQIEVHRHMALLPGDVVRNDGASAVAITYGNENTRVELQSGTTLKLLGWAKGKQFDLPSGKVEATVARQRWFRPLSVRTAQAEARVLGTKFTLATTTNTTRLDVKEGKVKLTRTSDGEAVKVLAGHYAVVATNYELAAQPLPGKVFREYWLDLPGGSLQDLTYHTRYPNAPSGHDFPPSFETSTNWPGAFGTRTRAYLLPPVSGDYEFRISGNGQVCLWLSPDEAPVDRVKIAQIVFTRNRPNDPGPETTRARQESGPIPLEAGRRYYIEAAHKYGSGEDRLTVTWKRPDGTQEPVPAEFLAPFVVEKKGAKK